jgi:Lrp/AsnC family transcriptional regulator, leucine-responsive regulatory protein
MDEKKKIKIDDLDLKIINELKADSQRSVRQLAKDLGESPSTIYNRIKRMEELEVLKNFTVSVDYSLLNLGFTAFVFIKFVKSNTPIRDAAKQIVELEAVHEGYLISGEYDMIAKLRSESMEKIAKIILDKVYPLPIVEKVSTSPVFETILEEKSQIFSDSLEEEN